MKNYRIPALLLILLCSRAATAQNRVLVEEFGGTWCGNCPYGTWILDSLKLQLGSRAVLLSWHQGDSLAIRAEDTLESRVHPPAYPSASDDRGNATTLKS